MPEPSVLDNQLSELGFAPLGPNLVASLKAAGEKEWRRRIIFARIVSTALAPILLVLALYGKVFHRLMTTTDLILLMTSAACLTVSIIYWFVAYQPKLKPVWDITTYGFQDGKYWVRARPAEVDRAAEALCQTIGESNVLVESLGVYSFLIVRAGSGTTGRRYLTCWRIGRVLACNFVV